MPDLTSFTSLLFQIPAEYTTCVASFIAFESSIKFIVALLNVQSVISNIMLNMVLRIIPLG